MTWPIPIGAKIRTKFDNDLDKLYHVRGHVDDKIVVRWWRAGKQRIKYAPRNYLVQLSEGRKVIVPKGNIYRKKKLDK